MINAQETVVDRSEFKEAAIKVGKVIGGTVLGALGGYLTAKGVDQFVIDVNDAEVAYTTISAVGSGILGGFIAGELS